MGRLRRGVPESGYVRCPPSGKPVRLIAEMSGVTLPESLSVEDCERVGVRVLRDQRRLTTRSRTSASPCEAHRQLTPALATPAGRLARGRSRCRTGAPFPRP